MRTIFPIGNGESVPADTDLTKKKNVKAGESEADVKFPKSIRHNGKGNVWAKIYAKSKSYPLYRVTWSVKVNGNSRRMVKAFATYADAKRHADARAKELADGSRVTALTPAQADDALAAFDRLKAFYVATGRKLSLNAVVSEYVESALRVPGRTLGEMVDRFKSTLATVNRKDLTDAVNQFITGEDARTKAENGKRADLSSKYAYNRAIMLRKFAGAFQNIAVCDLAKEHLDAFMGSLSKLKSKSRNGRPAASAKSRNHHRAALRQFLQWAVRKDYLSATHRLLEADLMRPERAQTADIEFYTPTEFAALLAAAAGAEEGSTRAMIAIGGLGGLRTQELLRLDWSDVWRVEGHIEITKSKAKTRQRRLVEICPALAAWLEPFRTFTTGKVCTMQEITWQQHFVELCRKAKYEKSPGAEIAVKRKPNGLRHSFCTYHFAAHSNENLTAMQAGNSPAMIHAHYKGLATKKEAEAWFAVSPMYSGNVIPLASNQAGTADSY